MPPPKIIIVTGANRGIGQAICRLLLSQSQPQNPSQNLSQPRPISLIATSRSGADLNFTPTGNHEVSYHRLDISELDSIQSFTEEVRKRYGRADVLVNNAGINLDAEYDSEKAKKTLDVNFGGTRDMCLTLLPLLKTAPTPTPSQTPLDPPRIVNLSSIASSLAPYPPSTQALFRGTPSYPLSLSILSHLQRDYLSTIAPSLEKEYGFSGPGRSYNFSKSLINSLTILLAREHPEILVNCCCPGWIDTDMGGLVGRGKLKPPKTADDGARIPVRLAVGDIGGLSGQYWANGSLRGKGEGEVQEW